MEMMAKNPRHAMEGITVFLIEKYSYNDRGQSIPNDERVKLFISQHLPLRIII